jgi:hypothetical protein
LNIPGLEDEKDPSGGPIWLANKGAKPLVGGASAATLYPHQVPEKNPRRMSEVNEEPKATPGKRESKYRKPGQSDPMISPRVDNRERRDSEKLAVDAVKDAVSSVTKVLESNTKPQDGSAM